MAFIMCTILVVSIMTGFSSGLSTDHNVYVSEDRIVMWEELPDSGTPEDYDLVSNLKYTAQKIYTASYFKGETRGAVIANLGLGIKYTQNVHNIRVVKGDKIFSEAISSSSMKSVAEQKYLNGDNILFRPAVKVNGDSAQYSDAVSKMEKDVYYARYGIKPNELTKEQINNSVILSARDDNAVRAAAGAKNSDGNAEDEPLTIDVPQTLVRGDDGYYRFTLELDPYESTKYSRNEVRTLAGADKNPLFHSVSISFVIDENWNPVTVSTYETYDIEIPVLGAMTLASNLTETFSDIDDENGVVPEEEFFESHIDNASGEEIGPQLSPADYLATAFGSYIDGSKNLDLIADLTVGGLKITDLGLSVDIGRMDIRASLGKLYIEYADDKVYLTLNKIKGYLPVSAAVGLIDDPAVKALLSGITLPDLGGFLEGDILSTVFENCDMTSEGGITCIHLSFELADGIAVDASIYIKDDGMVLKEISGTVTAFGTEIALCAKPDSLLRFPKVDSSYSDLSPLLGFVPDAISTALGKTYGIAGTVSLGGTSIGVDAYIDRTDGVTADVALDVLGAGVSVKYVNDTLYANIGGIGVKATAAELPDLIGAMTDAIGVDSDLLDLVLKLLPDSVQGWIDAVKTLDVSESKLDVGLSLLGMPVNISLCRDAGRLSALSVKAELGILGKTLKASIDLHITAPEQKQVTATGAYVEFADIVDMLPDIMAYVNAKDLTVAADGELSFGGHTVGVNATVGIDRNAETVITAAADLTAFGQSASVTYIDGIAYVSVGNGKNIKLKLDTKDVDSFAPAINRVIGALTANSGMTLTDIDVSELVTKALGAAAGFNADSFTVADGVLTLSASAGDSDKHALTVVFDVNTGKLTVNGKIAGVAIDGLTLRLKKTAADIVAPADADKYSDAAELVPALEILADVICEKAATVGLSFEYDGMRIDGTLKASFDGAFKAQLSVPTLTIQNLPALSIDVTIDGTAIYIKLAGGYNAAVVCGASDVPMLIQALGDVVPAPIAKLVSDLADAITSGDLKELAKLDFGAVMPNGADIAAVLDSAIGAISALDIADGAIFAGVAVSGTVIELSGVTDLSDLTVRTSVGGKELKVTASVAAGADAITVPSADYVSVDKFIPVITALLPFTGANGIEVTDLSVTLYDTAKNGEKTTAVTIAGDITVAFNDGLALLADITVGDIPLRVTVKDSVLYLALDSQTDADGIRLSCGITQSEITALLDKVTSAVPELGELVGSGLMDKLSSLLSSPARLADMGIELKNSDGGISIKLDLAPLGINYTAEIALASAENKLTAISVAVKGGKQDIALTFDTALDASGALGSISTSGDVYAAHAALNILTESPKITASGSYMPLSVPVDYIAPIYSLVTEMTDAKSLTVNLNASIVTKSYGVIELTAEVRINLDPLAVYAKLRLFTNTDSAEDLTVTYIGGKIYINTGNIKLSLDTATDIDAVLGVLNEYLPDYINTEIDKLLHPEKGASALSDIGLIVERFKQVVSARSAINAIGLLFAPLDNIGDDRTMAKTLIDMISILKTDNDELELGATLMGIKLTAVPALVQKDGEPAKLGTISLNAAISADLRLEATIASIVPKSSDAGIAVPLDADDYVSVAEFVLMINNAVHTFTSRYNNDITFEIKHVDFDYKGVSTLDENNKVIEGDTLTLSNKVVDGKEQSLLKGKFVRTETKNADGSTAVSYKFNLEAHVVITSSMFPNSGAITIDLYVLNDAKHNGEAYLCYHESATGYGENVYIDYASVMQIVAAVMDILNVDEDTIATLIPAEYRTAIDSTVFDSMDIAGLDKIAGVLNSIADLINNAKAGVADFKDGWELFKNAGSIDGLNAEITETAEDGTEKTDTRVNFIKSYFKNALSYVSSAMSDLDAIMGKSSGSEITVDAVAEMYKKVVNGVTLTLKQTAASEGSPALTVLGADVQNAITTGGTGAANIKVTESDGTIDKIAIQNLDVKSAVINAGINFVSGQNVEIALTDDQLAAIKSPAKNTDYSGFDNIKHLLFDVMNTANLGEFEIGDDTSAKTDKIQLGIKLLGVESIKIDIMYNIKVKLIDQGKGANPRYKTAAVVEFVFKDCSALGASVVEDCVTRLFFYNNMFYIQGIKDWSKEWNWIRWKYSYTPVYAAYTLDEFLNMIKTDMSKFLNEFVFYLLPLSTDFFTGINLKQKIVESVTDAKPTTATPTLATVYKGYTYDQGVHGLKLGLTELTGNDMLGDVNVSITGKNDGDSNLLDNYISNLSFTLSLINNSLCTINVRLYASLRNVQPYTDGVQRIRSSGLNNTTAKDIRFNGLSDDPIAKKSGGYSMTDLLKSFIPDTTWTRIWA